MIRRKEVSNLYMIDFVSIYKEKDSKMWFKEVGDFPDFIASLNNDSAKQLFVYEVDVSDASQIKSYIIYSPKHKFIFPCIYFSHSKQKMFDYVYYLASIYYQPKGYNNIYEVTCDRCGKKGTFNKDNVTAKNFLKNNISGMYEKDSTTIDICYVCANEIFCNKIETDFCIENIFINSKRNDV